MNTSYDRAAQDMPKTQPILESQARGFGNRAEEIIKITSALNDIANRTFGREPSPIDVAKTTAAPMQECTLGQLADSGEQLDKAITSLGRAVHRFESL